MTYTREYPYGASYAALVQVVQPLRGNPVFAVGGEYTGDASTWCIASAKAGDYGVLYLALGQDATSYEIDWSSWGAISSFTDHIFTSSTLGVPNQLGVGSSQAALGAGALMDFSSQTLHQATLPAGVTALDIPTMVPDGAYVVEQLATGLGLGLMQSAGSLSTVIDPTASSRSVTWLTVDRANANAIVWIESDSADLFSNPIIWTSPYATSSAGVTRTKVAAFQDTDGRGGADSVTNAGVMLNLTSDTTALLTRLSDGMGWAIAAEPSMSFVQALWADDTEVWILASSTGPHDPDRILRLQRSAMGSPTVSRGF